MTPETTKIIALWAVGGDTGISSKFLAACALGQPDAGERWIGHNTPSDRDDFGRCYRLAQILPVDDLKRALDTAATREEKWASVRDNWDLLCAKFEQASEPCDHPGACYNGRISPTEECPGRVHKIRRDFYQQMKQLGL